jgi:hypothetical protein
MKVLLFVALFIGLSNHSPGQKKLTVDDKIKVSVKKYLSLTMNDYKSYESVMWGKAEKILSEFNSDGRWNFILREVDSCNNVANSYKNTINDNLNQIKDYHERSKGSIPYYVNLYDSLANTYIAKNKILSAKKDSTLKLATYFQKFYNDREKEYIPSTIEGYMINHTFRGKNGFGGLIIQNYTFTLDSKFNVISAKQNTD